MPGDLTDTQIDLLCNIEEQSLSEGTDRQQHDLERLISDGYITPAHAGPERRFQLTVKGSDFLCARGAGLNEG
jgi:hypothetical protein